MVMVMMMVSTYNCLVLVMLMSLAIVEMMA